MLSPNTLRIIEFLLRHVPEEFNINQIARKTNMSPGGAHKILVSLEKDCVVSKKELGNAKYYRVDLEKPAAKSLAEYVLAKSREERLKKNVNARTYADDIKAARELSSVAILFGSILRSEDFRDVDALFVAEKKKIKKIYKVCMNISSIRTKKISPLIFLPEDMKKNLGSKDKVTLEILKTGIVLWGEGALTDLLKGAFYGNEKQA